MENEKSRRAVETAGKQRRTITASYVEDVTRVGKRWAPCPGSTSRATKRRLCREGTRLGAWGARKYGMVVESQEERVEIIAN